jgi:hypothetical protein
MCGIAHSRSSVPLVFARPTWGFASVSEASQPLFAWAGKVLRLAPSMPTGGELVMTAGLSGPVDGPLDVPERADPRHRARTARRTGSARKDDAGGGMIAPAWPGPTASCPPSIRPCQMMPVPAGYEAWAATAITEAQRERQWWPQARRHAHRRSA